MTYLRHIILLLFSAYFTACSSNALSEAKQTVAQADSVWAEGGMYSDSLSLAQAYETLSSFNYPLLSTLNSQLSTDFVHACYHYGKMLRAKDNPVAAMQVFINATHAGSDDKQILGRIYNNMGDICHRANEFDLSYNMFKRSADVFLSDKDTLSYYYCLNDMALELAEQGKKDYCLSLLQQIYHSHTQDNILMAYCLHSQIQAYIRCSQYDSAIICASKAKQYISYLPTIDIQFAQAYSFLGKKDSAVYYAKRVLFESNDLFDRNNALYILTADDKTKDIDEVRETAAGRSDTQKLIEISRSKHAQAVQLLEQDLNRKLSLAWLYAIIGTLVIVGACIWIYVHHKRLQRQLLSQQVDDLTSKKIAVQQHHEQIVYEHTKYTNKLITQVNQNCTILFQQENFPDNIYWKDFVAMRKLINDNFGMLINKLQCIYQLSEKEIRLCILVLIGNIGSKQMADLLCYGESGIRNYKNRIAKKLGTNSTELREFLINLAINEYSER